MEKRIITGIEIESVVNTDYVFIEDVGEYHDGQEINSFWFAERDGSIRHYNEFSDYDCIEFVSNKLSGKTGFFEALESFKRIIGTKNLKNAIAFNSSCGCHIHFSYLNYFHKKIPYKFFLQMREMFFNEVQNSTLSEETKKSVLNHYFRGYAKKIKPNHFIPRVEMEKYKEFNFGSESCGYGCEWRSFNLKDIKSWREFDILFKIAWDCIEFLCRKQKGYTINGALRINKKELKELIKTDERTINRINPISEKYIDFIDIQDINLNNNEVLEICVI